jgi:threonylcarbamoyladenosine tRNA methylthiotransferase MtaB
VAIGADLIAGFPTETDELFAETLGFVRDAAIPFLHVFPYSERPGTPAARMPAVPVAVRRERAAALRAVGDANRAAFLMAQVGREISLLTETEQAGHAEDFSPVRLGVPVEPARVLRARIVAANDDHLLAEPA